MSTRFEHLLALWYPRRDECEWVLGTITDTQMSTYRKAGAMMLFNSLGQMFGMLSGGCLEADLLGHARKALLSDAPEVVTYDLRDDSDGAWQKGLGCGGAVTIVLQPLSAKHQYLGLDQVHKILCANRPLVYQQRLDAPSLSPDCWHIEEAGGAHLENYGDGRSSVVEQNGLRWLNTLIHPAPQLLIFGGGPDAAPIAGLAANIGWHVIVVEHRVNYAKLEDFPNAAIIRKEPDTLEAGDIKRAPSAIVVMTHNLTLDAKALVYAKNSDARYVGVLGPQHRRLKVETLAGISNQDFKHYYAGPVGLDIGATLPETIALSILAECHQVVEAQPKQRID